MHSATQPSPGPCSQKHPLSVQLSQLEAELQVGVWKGEGCEGSVFEEEEDEEEEEEEEPKTAANEEAIGGTGLLQALGAEGEPEEEEDCPLLLLALLQLEGMATLL